MATSVAITSNSSLASTVHARRGRSTRARNNVPNNVSARRVGGFAGLQCRDCESLVSEMRGNQLRFSKRKTTRSRKAVVMTPVAVETRETGSSNKRSPLPSPNSPGSLSNTKGWIDERGNQNPRLIAQLHNIALAARDRAELHTIIGLQRDNWNKLCHTTVVTTTVASALLASLNGAMLALPLSVSAFLLNVGTFGLMVLAGKLQPSQLAEEQRSAARQCRSMAAEIEAALQIDPRLREDAHLYVEDKLTRLHDVDIAYPLPLTPNGLPKFPAVVKGSIVSAQVDLSAPVMPSTDTNGWSPAISEDLKQTSEKLRESDIEMYLGWARKKEKESLRFAIGAPVLVAMAAVINLLQCWPVFASVQTTSAAAVCSVAAMFCFSFGQGGQIGMIFEMYRNCAGSYADLDNTIQRAIRIPVCQREDGELFHEKIALQLGRENLVPLVRPGDKTAGNVF